MKTLLICFIVLTISGLFSACEDDLNVDIEGKIAISGKEFTPKKNQIIKYNKGFEFIFSGSGESITINTKDTINGNYTVPPNPSSIGYHRLEASVGYLKNNSEYVGDGGTIGIIISKSGSMEISINVTVANIDKAKLEIEGKVYGIERNEILDKTTPNKACFEYSPTEVLQVGTEISFTNCSKNATHYFWFFGDGITSTQENPTHIYSQAGQYEVVLVAQNTKFIDYNGDNRFTLDDISEDASHISKTISISQ